MISSLDHLVLTVQDVLATCAWYERVLKMEMVTFADGTRVALVFGSQKINLHPADEPISPHAQTPISGSADLCFLSSVSLREVQSHLYACGIRVELGPVERTGAQGAIKSLYIRDPDGNLIEISEPLYS